MNIKSSVAVACFLPGRAKDLSAPLYIVAADDVSWYRVTWFWASDGRARRGTVV